MERLACAEVPALPLQLLLRAHPEWRRHPSAVVAEDLPQSPVLWVNVRARDGGVSPGLRYGSALAIIPDLRAAPVSDVEVARAVDAVTKSLRGFSPNVEPAAGEPGVWWLDASGLERLHASLAAWAQSVRHALARDGYEAAVVAGFTRFGTYAAARAAGHGTRVFGDAEEERAAAGLARLRDLHLPPETSEALDRLGVRTVNDLLRLPAEALLERFGSPAERLHRMASGDLWSPLLPRPALEPVRRHLTFDTAETDAQRLVFIVKQMLHPMLARLASRGQALAALTVRLRLEREWVAHAIRPASPTLDAVPLTDLVRLRMESIRLDAGITEIVLEAGAVPATPEQLALMAEQPARDLEAGTRALDRLRARYGDDAVVCAVLRDGHLPEARFGWEPMARLPVPRPARTDGRSLVRRIFSRPMPLRRPEGAREAAGPFILSGGWWAAPPGDEGVREAHRTYYFIEGPRGELWWVFYDQVRRRWYAQGQVE